MKLLFSEPRRPDECSISYLIRIAEYNGFRKASNLLSYAGLQWKNNRLPIHSILTGEFDLDTLLNELELPPIGVTKISQFHAQFRNKIDSPRILTTHPKICPLCVKETGYAKEAWNLLPVTCCPKHKLMLIDRNSTDGKMLSWFRPHLAYFDNHHKIDQEIKAPPILVELSRIFESLLQSSETCQKGPQILRDLTPNECLSLLNFITHFQVKIEGSSLLSSNDNLTTAAQYQKSFRTLKNWPEDFYQMLSTFINKPMTKLQSQGIRKHFRTLHDQLFLQRENAGIIRIRKEFETYIQSQWPTALNSNRLKRISIDPEQKQLVSIIEAKNILKCHIPKIQHLVDTGVLEEFSFKDKKYFKRSEIEDYLINISENWSLNEACYELGLSKHKLNKLLETGFIPFLTRPSDKNRDWLIDRKGAIFFFENLRRNASNRQPKLTQKCYSLEGFLKQGNSFEITIQMMLKGKVNYRFIVDKEKPYGFQQFIAFQYSF